jgi:hypothetical protein
MRATKQKTCLMTMADLANMHHSKLHLQAYVRISSTAA